MSKNVILVGNSGAGKSTIAPMLASKLRFGYLDTDAFIEANCKRSIVSIFQQHGEEYFRRLEQELLDSFLTKGGIKHNVIAAGGGLPCYAENWSILKKLGVIVWVYTEQEIICQRFMRDFPMIKARPNINSAMEAGTREEILLKLKDRLEELNTSRASVYSRADIVIDNSFSTPEFCALCVAEDLNLRLS